MMTRALGKTLWISTLKGLRALGLACTLVACAGLGSAERGIGEQRILLGQSLPGSGPLAGIALAYSEGALGHFATLNRAGGIHGRQIEVLSLDDAGDTRRALANTRELIYRHQVFALINYFGAETLAAHGSIVQAERIPLLAPESRPAKRPGTYHRYLFAFPALDDATGDLSLAKARGRNDAQLLTRALTLAGRDLTREKWIAALEQIESRHQFARQLAYRPTHRLEPTREEPRLLAAIHD